MFKNVEKLLPDTATKEARYFSKSVSVVLQRVLDEFIFLRYLWDFENPKLSFQYVLNILDFFGFLPLPPSISNDEKSVRKLASRAGAISKARGSKIGIQKLIENIGYGSANFDFSKLYQNTEPRTMDMKLFQAELGTLKKEDAKKYYSRDEQKLLILLFSKFSRLSVPINIKSISLMSKEDEYSDLNQVSGLMEEKQNAR